jgi:iron complex transport system ATP-binding protein
MSLRLDLVSLGIEGHPVLNAVDYELAPGNLVAIIGANGAGKTSLLRVLSGETPPSVGDVWLDDRRIGAWTLAQLANRFAVLPQSMSLEFPFTGYEVIEMGRIPFAGEEDRNQQAIKDVIAAMKLASLADRRYTSLSGGEKQRIQIARVLCQVWDHPDDAYLLMDEPTGPLDLAHQIQCLNLLRDLSRRGVGVMMVMHDINLAVKYADQILLMNDGSILACGSPAEVIVPATLEQAFSVIAEVSQDKDSLPVINVTASLV